MKQITTPEGMRLLRASWALLAASIFAGLVIVGATFWFVERESRESRAGTRSLQEARTRVESARRDRQSFEQSASIYKTLIDRGLMQPERRLELVELVGSLRARFQLLGLDYEIAPQRLLTLAGGRDFPALELFSSRVKLRARALHEGDLVGFMDALESGPQGFYPIDRCVLRRLESPPAESLQARVEADCTLEWITLKEKRRAG